MIKNLTAANIKEISGNGHCSCGAFSLINSIERKNEEECIEYCCKQTAVISHYSFFESYTNTPSVKDCPQIKVLKKLIDTSNKDGNCESFI